MVSVLLYMDAVRTLGYSYHGMYRFTTDILLQNRSPQLIMVDYLWGGLVPYSCLDEHGVS